MKLTSTLALVLAVLLTAFSLGYSQQKIAVQNGANVSFYANLDTAITYAPANSDVYIPGGTFYINTAIRKKLNIYGVGHFPDSVNLAAGRTIVDGNFKLSAGADNGSLQGIYLTGSVFIGDSLNNDAILNYSFIRNNVSSIFLGIDTSAPYSSNILINSNVIRGDFDNMYAFNVYFTNNYIQGFFLNVNKINSSVTISNNIFSRITGGYPHQDKEFYIFLNVNNTLIQNNIFMNNYFLDVCCGYQCYNTLRYNFLYSTGASGCPYYYQVSPTTISNNLIYNNSFIYDNPLFFNNYSANNFFGWYPINNMKKVNSNYFDYNADYHLKDTAIGKRGGTDSTDIGIYGGSSPWKDGGTPINPRIIQSIIPGETNNGKLNINIKVEAQKK